MSQIDIWNKKYSRANNNADLSKDVWIKKYYNYFNEKRNYTIIDLGCGRGGNSQYLFDNGFDIIACDFSIEALNSIKSMNKSIHTECFDMTRGIPLPKGNIGLVLASLSTHYFSLSDTMAIYRDVFNILEKGGYFIFRVNSIQEYLENDKDEVVLEIEKNYYRLGDGTTKRYFSINSIADLLKDFHTVELNEGSFMYHENLKYFIEGIVQKV